MVAVAQLVEPLTVTQVVVGSSPIGHPIQEWCLSIHKKTRRCGFFYGLVKTIIPSFS